MEKCLEWTEVWSIVLKYSFQQLLPDLYVWTPPLTLNLVDFDLTPLQL